ncbi:MULTISPECIES: ubiquinol oxidase subunit II [Pseudomonadota]
MMKTCWNRIRYPLTALAVLSLSGCDWVLFNSKGAVGIAQRDLIILCIALMMIVVVPAIVLSFYFPWRYRSTNKNATYAPDWSHSTKIELVVWGVPILIIAVLSVIVWKSTHELDPYKPLEAAGEPLHIEVIATDWKWVFVYPDLGIATINQLNFPANRPLAFDITSNSTMNTFFIPQLGGQIYAMAGMRTKLHLIANEPGKFRGMSGNYSGHGFSQMNFIATATSEEDFQRWVTQVRSNAPITFDFEAFKRIAKPSQGNAIVHFAKVEPGLFKKVIDQFIGVGENATPQVSLRSETAEEERE